MPGFPNALARTVHELRLAGVGPDASRTAARVRRHRAAARARRGRAGPGRRRRPRGALCRGRRGVRAGGVRWAGLPIVLLDVPLDSPIGAAFAAALAGGRPTSLAHRPRRRQRPRVVLAGLGAGSIAGRTTRARRSDLVHLRRYIFLSEPPPARGRAGDVRLFSAPGEGREAVEIVRRVLDEAARGVPFDEMACRAAHAAALSRAARARLRPRGRAGLVRSRHAPSRSGRARVHRAAVLRVRAALGQALRRVPLARAGAAERAGCSRTSDAGILPTRRDVRGRASRRRSRSEAPDEDDAGDTPAGSRFRRRGDRRGHAARAVEMGRAHRRVGGRRRARLARTAKRRWRRRLDGLAADYRLRLDELRRDEPESPRIRAVRARPANLAHLRELRAADHRRRWPTGRTRRAGASGSIGSARWRRACSARPARVLRDAGRPAADGRRRSGVARGGARRAAATGC